MVKSKAPIVFDEEEEEDGSLTVTEMGLFLVPCVVREKASSEETSRAMEGLSLSPLFSAWLSA